MRRATSEEWNDVAENFRLTFVISWTGPFPFTYRSVNLSVHKNLFLGSCLLFSCKIVESAIPRSDLHRCRIELADVTARSHSYSCGPRLGRSRVEFSVYDWRNVRQYAFASSRSWHRPNQISSGSISKTSVKNLRDAGTNVSVLGKKESQSTRGESTTYTFQARHAPWRL